MRKSLSKILITALAVLACLLAAPLGAQMEVPRATGFVNDYAGIIPGNLKAQTEAVIRTVKERTGAEIAVLTVDTTGGEEIFDFAMRVAEQWKVGRAGEDDGVLMVVAPNDRKMHILVGYGLEGVLPDGKVGGIEDDYIIPYFKSGDYGQGIYNGVLAIAQVIDPGIQGAQAPVYRRGGQPLSPREELIRMVVMFAGLVLMIILFIKYPRLFLLFLLMGGGRGRRGGFGGGFGGGGFGGGGGGFGGFGGGGFGGGGAGRGW